MGALHEGHAALIRSARQLAGPRGAVVVSIFVNPTQFGPQEDFSKYPRPLRRDLALCRACGADAVFSPAPDALYAPDHSVTVDESLASQSLCGRSRPGHFCGVCTVVAILFHLVEPTHAIFGEKDWQQLTVLRRMVRDLHFPITIVGHPTIREADGLAKSSRNAYLSPAERTVAPAIHAALCHAARRTTPAAIVSAAKAQIAKIPGARLDYLEAVAADTLQPLRSRKSNGRLAIAVHLGTTRLIDNIPLPPLP